MHSLRWLVTSLSIASALSLMACTIQAGDPTPPSEKAGAGGQDTGGEDGEPVCTPGSTQACVGSKACEGGQTCLPDGSGYGACDCGDQEVGGQSGSGGSAGQAGQSATGGQGGKAGTGGQGTGGSSGSTSTEVLPKAVNVRLQTVYFAPATADGTAWDSNTKIPSGVISGVASALAEPITAAVAAKVLGYLQDIAIDKYDNPDPIVYGYVLENGKSIFNGWLVDPDSNEEDNYAPQFTNVGLDNVPLGPKYALQLDIDDEDLSQHDSAGTPVITYDDLREALKLKGKPYFVNTSKEAVGQVLFVAISVFPAE